MLKSSSASVQTSAREQGREYDQLVKRDGKWLIKKRVVIADSGLPKSMLDTWKRKLDYDIGAK